MIIHLKNKYQLAFTRMLQECEEKGGIPDYIEADPPEAWEILKEIQSCRDNKEAKAKFKIETQSGTEDARFVIYGTKPIDIDIANVLVNRWLRGEINIEYDNVPVRVVRPKKAVKIPVETPDDKPKEDPNKEVDKDPETE